MTVRSSLLTCVMRTQADLPSPVPEFRRRRDSLGPGAIPMAAVSSADDDLERRYKGQASKWLRSKHML
jgi:hypothetical protein